MIKRILELLGIREAKTGEQWYRTVRNGVVYLESETSRRYQAMETARKDKMAKVRKETGFNERDVEGNADRLMQLLETCYQFGDPTFSPGVIYLSAAEKFGFEQDYVDSLIGNLEKRKIVRFEYHPNPDCHPRESIEYWRLFKNGA